MFNLSAYLIVSNEWYFEIIKPPTIFLISRIIHGQGIKEIIDKIKL